MYRRTIEVNPFSSKSINSAIMSLQREKNRLKNDFKESFLKWLGLELKGQLEWEFDSESVEVEYSVEKNSVTVRAVGEGIAFIEFGAGIYAEDGEYHSDHVPFYPGSWSEEHARTYQEWVANGMIGEYQFNQEPAHAFDSIIGELDTHIRNAADHAYKEVYGK